MVAKTTFCKNLIGESNISKKYPKINIKNLFSYIRFAILHTMIKDLSFTIDIQNNFAYKVNFIFNIYFSNYIFTTEKSNI
jgi:hypothetical protein